MLTAMLSSSATVVLLVVAVSLVISGAIRYVEKLITMGECIFGVAIALLGVTLYVGSCTAVENMMWLIPFVVLFITGGLFLSLMAGIRWRKLRIQ